MNKHASCCLLFSSSSGRLTSELGSTLSQSAGDLSRSHISEDSPRSTLLIGIS